MVRASCPLIIKDGQDAHPTKLGNLFFGVPLELACSGVNIAGVVSFHGNLVVRQIYFDG